jgi:hypothetical protein
MSYAFRYCLVLSLKYLYNFVVNMIKSGAEKNKSVAWEKTYEWSDSSECEKNGVNNKDNEPATSSSATSPCTYQW